MTSFTLDYGTEPLYIGYDGILTDGLFDGAIDEVRIWNATLDEVTLRQWMHREVNSSHPDYANLVGYWKLNEGSSNTAYDASDNGNNGTLYGGINWASSSAPINNLTTHRNDIAALWENRPSTATDGFATGLDIADVDFLNDVGDDIVFGHNNAAFANVTSGLPEGIDKRWSRIWELAVTNVSPASQYVDLIFDISDAGGQGSFSELGTYFLLKRAAGSSDPFTTVEVYSSSVAADQLTFRVDVTNLGSEFTLGATAGSPTAVIISKFAVRRTDSVIPLAGIFALSVFSIPLIRYWRRSRGTHA